jgi:Adenylate and Guanylate cyclase catalytic domain/3'5'-cyclic nucleotide phosphodiesterase
LETLYREFDAIAKRRGVFKVETVGDCYVAVCGLPDPCKEHAVAMTRFARDCLNGAHQVTRRLEVELGPDTTELAMRIGLHSGPVTAGVLRGERARFQLFGDTVNTAARMESTGKPNRIHMSQTTAELLMASGKRWVSKREDLVFAKGKGQLQTYWLDCSCNRATTNDKTQSGDSTDTASNSDIHEHAISNVAVMTGHLQAQALLSPGKQARLVDWNVEILTRLLREVLAQRAKIGTKPDDEIAMLNVETTWHTGDNILLDEVQDMITLPGFDPYSAVGKMDPHSIAVPDPVTSQLHEYVRTISSLYRNNAFHNFEHASHVTMSAVKLLGRIVAPELKCASMSDLSKVLHDHTFGISSDPLTHFSVVLSALIHDADHTGVPNSRLIEEHASIAAVYMNKSIAEQNSIDVAWKLLMQAEFKDLRRAIYSTEAEFKRFRQLIVNTVMATDIMDKEAATIRKERWNKAFEEEVVGSATNLDTVNRRATIVIEHLIQASDVAHTMQHWHIYRKWNARLFEEMHAAYKDGRSDKDPSESWYEDELCFFDFYVIPLAMQLRSCGVFGVSSDECLNYAQQNRQEWERRGRDVVAELVESFK